MKLYVCIATIIIACLVDYNEAAGALKFNEEEIFNCYFIIICDLRKPLELKRLILKSGPELIRKVFVWFEEISLIPNASDTPEFWNAYPDHRCDSSEEVKRDTFNAWIKKLGEYWAAACNEDPMGIECTSTEDAAMELNAIITEYTANGSCSSGAEKKGKGAMKPPASPSFG